MMTATRPYLLDLEFKDLTEIFESWGQPPYRARQLWHGIYRNLWRDPSDFTDLPIGLREKLADNFRFTHLEPRQALQSLDGYTQKTLFSLPGGQRIEAVLMRYARRRTLCISTQVGCALGCVFCATGQMGFQANLSSGEIVEQVLFYARSLQASGQRPTNVVLMGMGEPFHNYEATMTAIDRLNDPSGLNLGARRFTVSTVGLIPEIKRFTRERRQVNLAVSLHAADDELRSQLLPINRKYPLDPLMAACREYVDLTGRRISFEWALIQGVNDSLEQAARLAERLRDMLCHVNIIPLNPTHAYPGSATPRKQARAFKAVLERKQIPCTIRVRRGIEIEAGCGQLAVSERNEPQ